MDSYAVKMLKRHLGRQFYSDDRSHRYVAFVRNFQELKRLSGFTGKDRQLDRYLWLAGEFVAWQKGPRARINVELAALFANLPREIAALLSVLSG